MTTLSRYTPAVSSEVGDIERRLQALQRSLENWEDMRHRKLAMVPTG